MSQCTKLRIDGWWLTLIMSGAVTWGLALAFIVGGRLEDYDMPLPAIAFFALVSWAMTTVWLVADARTAFDRAAEAGYIEVDPDTGIVMWESLRCPSRWFVHVHTLLHPELLGCDRSFFRD